MTTTVKKHQAEQDLTTELIDPFSQLAVNKELRTQNSADLLLWPQSEIPDKGCAAELERVVSTSVVPEDLFSVEHNLQAEVIASSSQRPVNIKGKSTKNAIVDQPHWPQNEVLDQAYAAEVFESILASSELKNSTPAEDDPQPEDAKVTVHYRQLQIGETLSFGNYGPTRQYQIALESLINSPLLKILFYMMLMHPYSHWSIGIRSLLWESHPQGYSHRIKVPFKCIKRVQKILVKKFKLALTVPGFIGVSIDANGSCDSFKVLFWFQRPQKPNLRALLDCFDELKSYRFELINHAKRLAQNNYSNKKNVKSNYT